MGNKPATNLSGEAAQEYLLATDDGKSLLAAVTASQFGLKAREQSPFDAQSRAGYLGRSHDQNLNAWFAHDGVTVRPTVSTKEREHAWQLGFRLKALGYGTELADAPPIVRQTVEGNRIEYHRSHDRPIVEAAVSAALPGDLQATRLPLQDAASPPLTEWYVNRPEGIEQGFTLNEPPRRRNYVLNEELRLVMSLEGDLHAQLKENGQAIALLTREGKGALSYSKLIAIDAEGKQLAARMEASVDGREIALVVADQNAAYPIVIDPITASSEQRLDGGGFRQVDARFGFAVAIERDIGVVGAWRYDGVFGADIGQVRFFTRAGSTWTAHPDAPTGGESNAGCGWSVAISGNRVVYGCPGANSQTGMAELYDFGSRRTKVLVPTSVAHRSAGEQLGFSVAISGRNIAVGAPTHDDKFGAQNVGANFIFRVEADESILYQNQIVGSNTPPNQLLGTSVAIEGDTVISGAPGAGAGYVSVHYIEQFSGLPRFKATLVSGDGEAGDNFGNSVDISGSTAVVGAFGDDDKGTDAGAAYVFVRDDKGAWSQQQKIKAIGSRAGDHFSEHAVAIQFNTIVVGATAWDFFAADDAGAAYIFTRSDTVWTEQTELQGASSYNFGIAVDISGNSVLIGARGADVESTARTGAAYVYRLDCVPPSESFLGFVDGNGTGAHCLPRFCSHFQRWL